MSQALLGVASLLLLSLLLGMVRVVRGPTAGDRMLAAQLVGTTAVATLLVFSRALRLPALEDISLVFALLAGVAGISFASFRGDAPEAPP